MSSENWIVEWKDLSHIPAEVAQRQYDVYRKLLGLPEEESNMAWDPRRGGVLRQELSNTRFSNASPVYHLAVVAAGGESMKTDRLADKLHRRLPELIEKLIVEVERDFDESVVLVCFTTNGPRYPYRNTDGVKIGDRVAVWSPCAEKVDPDTGQGIAFGTVAAFGGGMNASKPAWKVPR